MAVSELGTESRTDAGETSAFPHAGATARLSQRLLAHLSRETSSGRFIPEMDGLRFVAISMVIFFHLNGYLSVKSPAYYAYPQTGWLSLIAAVGFRGVELFFVISGFILGLPFAAHHLKGSPPVQLRKYYLRRLARLEPPYFVAALMFFLLAIVMQGKSVVGLSPHLAASMLYLHNLIYACSSSVIGVAWSLEIEVQFYLLVPVLTLLFAIKERWLRRLVLAGAMAGVMGLQSLFLHDSPRASLSILAYIQYFLVGFLLADVFLTDWNQTPRRLFRWDLAALAGWPILFFVLHSPQLTHWLFPELAFLLYVSAFRGPIFNRIFIYPWITAIGGMCYSIYLIHYEVISAVGRFSKRITDGSPYWFHLLAQSLLVGTAIAAASGLYFVFLEKPCMRRDWPARAGTLVHRLLNPHPAEAGSDANRA